MHGAAVISVQDAGFPELYLPLPVTFWALTTCDKPKINLVNVMEWLLLAV